MIVNRPLQFRSDVAPVGAPAAPDEHLHRNVDEHGNEGQYEVDGERLLSHTSSPQFEQEPTEDGPTAITLSAEGRRPYQDPRTSLHHARGPICRAE